MKDHKEEFPEKSLFRLISPSKSEIKKVSKYILDKINKLVIEATKLSAKIKILSSNGLRVSKIKQKLVLLYLTLEVVTPLCHQSYSTRV